MCIRDRYSIDGVFLIIPDLIRECIIGIGLLQESRCVIDLKENQITFNRHEAVEDAPEYVEILAIEVDQEEKQIGEMIREKMEEITGVETREEGIRGSIDKNRQIFREQPGKITKY